MGIFDKLKNVATQAAGNAIKQGISNLGNKSETFTFTALPESVEQLQSLPRQLLTLPLRRQLSPYVHSALMRQISRQELKCSIS